MNNIRLVIPWVQGRGAGLGNEMINWGKAFIVGQLINGCVLHPAWGLNSRNYRKNFKTVRFDWLYQRALCAVLPTIDFTDEIREEHGGDLITSFKAFAAENQLDTRPAIIIKMSGMGGGFEQLGAARNFLIQKLLATNNTVNNLTKIDMSMSREKLRIGLHIRRGDFIKPLANENHTSKFNISINLNWYMNFCRNLLIIFKNNVEFLVITDASDDEIKPILDTFPCFTTYNHDYRDVSDLLALSQCDFVLCSISSYSMWAVFLSSGVYGWYKPQLHLDGNYYSIWGHETSQAHPDSPHNTSLKAALSLRKAGGDPNGRGFAIPDDGTAPEQLLVELEQILAKKSRHFDLIRYGVIQA